MPALARTTSIPPKLLDRAVDSRLDGSHLGHVAVEVGSARADLGSGLGELLRLEPGEGDPGTTPGRLHRDGRADPSGAPGDEDDFAVQVHPRSSISPPKRRERCFPDATLTEMERRLSRRQVLGGAVAATGAVVLTRQAPRSRRRRCGRPRTGARPRGRPRRADRRPQAGAGGVRDATDRGPRPTRRTGPHDPRLHRRPARRVRRRGDRHQAPRHPAPLPKLRPAARKRLQRLRNEARDDLPPRPQLPRLPLPDGCRRTRHRAILEADRAARPPAGRQGPDRQRRRRAGPPLDRRPARPDANHRSRPLADREHDRVRLRIPRRSALVALRDDLRAHSPGTSRNQASSATGSGAATRRSSTSSPAGS